MARLALTPAAVGSIVAVVVALAGLGYLVMLYLGTAVTPVVAAPGNYDTGILHTELNTDNAQSIFLSTVPLSNPGGAGNATTYSPSELGKKDITQIGQ